MLGWTCGCGLALHWSSTGCPSLGRPRVLLGGTRSPRKPSWDAAQATPPARLELHPWPMGCEVLPRDKGTWAFVGHWKGPCCHGPGAPPFCLLLGSIWPSGVGLMALPGPAGDSGMPGHLPLRSRPPSPGLIPPQLLPRAGPAPGGNGHPLGSRIHQCPGSSSSNTAGPSPRLGRPGRAGEGRPLSGGSQGLCSRLAPLFVLLSGKALDAITAETPGVPVWVTVTWVGTASHCPAPALQSPAPLCDPQDRTQAWDQGSGAFLWGQAVSAHTSAGQ